MARHEIPSQEVERLAIEELTKRFSQMREFPYSVQWESLGGDKWKGCVDYHIPKENGGAFTHSIIFQCQRSFDGGIKLSVEYAPGD